MLVEVVRRSRGMHATSGTKVRKHHGLQQFLRHTGLPACGHRRLRIVSENPEMSVVLMS